ncbi:MAG: hypothetical protein HY686_01000 [Chloroflexi bacterium]|nr:hypothetical protein [Chloroflexota bacterium]
MLEVSFGQTLLRVPETPQYLQVAIQLLETLHRELDGRGGAAPGELIPSEGESHRGGLQPASGPSLRGIAEGPESGGGRRVRWFITHLPRITLPDGGVATPSSVGELREFIGRRGLKPHRRGDASMLLWQVRQRLKLAVEAVPL